MAVEQDVFIQYVVCSEAVLRKDASYGYRLISNSCLDCWVPGWSSKLQNLFGHHCPTNSVSILLTGLLLLIFSLSAQAYSCFPYFIIVKNTVYTNFWMVHFPLEVGFLKGFILSLYGILELLMNLIYLGRIDVCYILILFYHLNINRYRQLWPDPLQSHCCGAEQDDQVNIFMASTVFLLSLWIFFCLHFIIVGNCTHPRLSRYH